LSTDRRDANNSAMTRKRWILEHHVRRLAALIREDLDLATLARRDSPRHSGWSEVTPVARGV